MSKTRRFDKRDHEGRDEVKAFYTRVKPRRNDEDFYFDDTEAPSNVVALRPRQMARKARR